MIVSGGRQVLFLKDVASAVRPNSIGWHHTQKCIFNTNCTWVIKIIKTENTNLEGMRLNLERDRAEKWEGRNNTDIIKIQSMDC